MWQLTPSKPWEGTLAKATLESHISIGGVVNTNIKLGKADSSLSLDINTNAKLAVNMDMNKNGFGGLDHGVMIDLDASPTLNAFNGKFTIDLGQMTAAAVWKVGTII